MMLRRNSVQALFNGYHCDTQTDKSKDLNQQTNNQNETSQKLFRADRNEASSIYQQESTYNNNNQATGPA